MGTLKIKKVDDKPMVIHTKKKAKIHMHEPKKAKIKGSNIYTVQRGPKIASAKINDTGKKKSYRKSTIHQAEKKEKEPSKFKRNIREYNTSTFLIRLFASAAAFFLKSDAPLEAVPVTGRLASYAR